MNLMFEKLRPHIGHAVALTTYGDHEDPYDICIECLECNEVLVSAESFTEEETKLAARNGNRPCLVKGQLAWFHGWFYKEKAVIQVPYVIKSEARQQAVDVILKNFNERGYTSGGIGFDKISNVMALVEYEDGCIGEVEPIDIRFID